MRFGGTLKLIALFTLGIFIKCDNSVIVKYCYTAEVVILQTSEDIVLQPGSRKADASIIWLHGLGADASDFLAITDQLGLPANHTVKFIFPRAPQRKITINQGLEMPGWYDIYSLQFVVREDDAGIIESSTRIKAIINHEIQQCGILPKRIILAGFSQGAAISLHTGLRFIERLGGIIGLSGYQLRSKSLAEEMSINSLQTPIFLAHGLFDPMVAFQLGVDAKEQLQSMGFIVNWHSYPMQHTVTTEEIQDIGVFIQQVLQY